MEIVRRHERSEGAIRNRLEKRGLLTHDSAIVRHFRGGWSIDEIAEHYGQTPTAIREQFKRSGIDLDEPEARNGTPEHASDTVPPSPPEQPLTAQEGSAEEDLAHDTCRHEVEGNQCDICKDDDKPDVYITAGGQPLMIGQTARPPLRSDSDQLNNAGEIQQRYAGSVAIQVRLRAASRVTSACPLRTNAEA